MASRAGTIGLALSGGGFRATLFHVGALIRLNELSILGRVTRIASVSGGSITAGYLGLRWQELGFAGGRSARLDELVVQPLRAFCRRKIDALAIGEGVLLPWRGTGDALTSAYRKHLFGARRLDQLPDSPRFIFMATNLQTGRSFRISKPHMGDYLIGLIRNPRLDIAAAVAASSAFPPFLSPVVIDAPGPVEAVEGAIFAGDPRYTRRLFLTDGGVYDNLGLEPVWDNVETVLVGDAGAPFAYGEEPEADWLNQANRALDIATDQARGLRKRMLVGAFQRGERAGAYWGIDTDIRDYRPAPIMATDPARTDPLARIRTRLAPFTEAEQGLLINWGYALCDAAIARRAPQLAPAPPQPAWPVPDHPLA